MTNRAMEIIKNYVRNFKKRFRAKKGLPEKSETDISYNS